MEGKTNEILEKMAKLAGRINACRPFFIAMGDENRQHIIIALLENCGGMRVGELTARTNLSRPAVSHHLKVLKDAGIVSMFKKGTMNFYHIDTNESQWEEMASLFAHINNLVQEVSEKQKSGILCKKTCE